MDDREELLATINHLAYADTGPLVCEESGHASGHVCLTSAGEENLPAIRTVTGWDVPRTRTVDWADVEARL